MPKMKTKSSAKKRFRFTATGKIKFKASRVRHGMIKRPQQMKRDARAMQILSDVDARIVCKYMPYR